MTQPDYGPGRHVKTVHRATVRTIQATTRPGLCATVMLELERPNAIAESVWFDIPTGVALPALGDKYLITIEPAPEASDEAPAE